MLEAMSHVCKHIAAEPTSRGHLGVIQTGELGLDNNTGPPLLLLAMLLLLLLGVRIGGGIEGENDG